MPFFEIRLGKEIVQDGHTFIKAVQPGVVSRCEYCERVYWQSKPKCECGKVPLLHKVLLPIRKKLSYVELRKYLQFLELKDCPYEVFEIEKISLDDLESKIPDELSTFKEPEELGIKSK